MDVRTGDGVVAGDDGRRYTFGPSDWSHRGEPAIGAEVDFETDQNRALSIFPLPGSPLVAASVVPTPARDVENDRNKYIAALLAFFLGPLGVHRFYLGRTGSGVAMLILSIIVVGLVVTIPWSLIDTVRYLAMSDREFARRYARD